MKTFIKINYLFINLLGLFQGFGKQGFQCQGEFSGVNNF